MGKIWQTARDWSLGVLTAGDKRMMAIGERSRIIFLNAVTLAGAAMIALFAAIGLAGGNRPLATVCLVASSLVMVNFAGIRLFKRYFLGGAIDCAIIFVFYFYLSASGGEAGSGVLWSMTYPLIALFLLGPLWGSAVALAYGAALGVAVIHPALNGAGLSLPFSVRVLGTYFFIWLFAFIYEMVRTSTQKRLQETNVDLISVTDQLVHEKKQTDDILSGVLEGIFLLSADGKLGAVHSRHLELLLEKTLPEGADFVGLLEPGLPERDAAACRDYIGMLVAGTVNPDLLAEINPLAEIGLAFAGADGSARSKRLRFQFIKVAVGDAPYPILGVVTDVTDEYELKRRLETEERAHRRTMESLFQIIHVDPAMMREFIADTEAELEAVNDLMRGEAVSGREVLDSLFQSAHAVKGNASLLGLAEFAAKVHEFEDQVKRRLDGGHAWRDLLELTLGLADIKRELDSIKELINKIMRFQTDTKAAGLEKSSLLRFSVEKLIKREAARSGRPVAVEFEGFAKRSLPDEYRKLVKDVLVQFIRNSFAHGFESAGERTALGKSETARISLALEWTDAAVTLRYADDGRGLEPARLRAKALTIPELAPKAAAMSSGELAKLIFQAGFTTAADAGVGSGRGIGMALVKHRIGEAGGRLAVKTAPGRVLEFSITLPVPESARAVS
jgi:signal transduction histidine kinase